MKRPHSWDYRDGFGWDDDAYITALEKYCTHIEDERDYLRAEVERLKLERDQVIKKAVEDKVVELYNRADIEYYDNNVDLGCHLYVQAVEDIFGTSMSIIKKQKGE